MSYPQKLTVYIMLIVGNNSFDVGERLGMDLLEIEETVLSLNIPNWQRHCN